MRNEIPKHEISDIVYSVLDKDQNSMFVISYWVKPNSVMYECKNTFGNASYYYDFELSKEQNILTKIK